MMRLICSIDWRSGERPLEEKTHQRFKSRSVRSIINGGGAAKPASVTAEDLLVHDSGDRQTVETVGERLPQFDVEPALACGKKNKNKIYRSEKPVMLFHHKV